MDALKVLLASSEVAPFAKTGGLADVAGSLPKALKKLNVDIRVVMPMYNIIPKKFEEKMVNLGNIYVDIGWRHQYCGVFMLVHDGVTFYFIDNIYYFHRGRLYGHYDEAEQFTFFSRAVLEILPFIDFKPDIIHCNDWQTALVSLFLKDSYKADPFYSDIKTIYTIHNLKYQGSFSKEIMDDLLHISWERYFKPYGVEFHDRVNLMKAGIVYSDIVSTVSKTYAQEILTDYFGEQLNGILAKRANYLYGIVNGIDYEINNPETDKMLFANYSANDLKGKAYNKRKLQESAKLPVKTDVPLIGIISRLVGQKGFDLLDCILDELLSEDVQIIVLGTGDYQYEEMFRSAAHRYPHKISATIDYNSLLSQRIYAGSDMFLMPSLFEPCGLSQMISLRYGTIPIVRETGGLKDTITSYNEVTDEGNGFTFTNYNAHDMLYTIRRAISFYHQKNIWNKLVKRAMHCDFSWEASAGEYLKLYKSLIRLP